MEHLIVPPCMRASELSLFRGSVMIAFEQSAELELGEQYLMIISPNIDQQEVFSWLFLVYQLE